MQDEPKIIQLNKSQSDNKLYVSRSIFDVVVNISQLHEITLAYILIMTIWSCDHGKHITCEACDMLPKQEINTM